MDRCYDKYHELLGHVAFVADKTHEAMSSEFYKRMEDAGLVVSSVKSSLYRYQEGSNALLNGLLRGRYGSRDDSVDSNGNIRPPISDRSDTRMMYLMDQVFMEAMEHSKTTEPMIVYRGVQDVEALRNVKVGDTFTDKGYTSTSVNPQTAMIFARTEITPDGLSKMGGKYNFSTGDEEKVDYDITYTMVIKVPEGTGIIPVKTGLGFDKEQEVILQKGLTYKVVAIHKDSRTMEIEVVK